MRIRNNYQGIMQVFSRMSGGKTNTSNGYYCGNTIYRDSVNALYSKGGKGIDMQV